MPCSRQRRDGAALERVVDRLGRVKVWFRWDRVGPKNERSCCYVRVATPWASRGYGIITTPGIGDEVVVSFLEGNPDRPLITGAVVRLSPLNGTREPFGEMKLEPDARLQAFQMDPDGAIFIVTVSSRILALTAWRRATSRPATRLSSTRTC